MIAKGGIGAEFFPLLPDPCQGKPGSQMDICFLDRKDVQFSCHRHIIIPNIIFARKCKYGFDKKWINKYVETVALLVKKR